jgi:hypothetical protein
VYDYARNLFDLLLPKLDIIFYTHPDDVELEDDGERSVDVKFRNDIVLGMKHFLGYKECKNRVVTLSGTPEDRMKTILTTMSNL